MVNPTVTLSSAAAITAFFATLPVSLSFPADFTAGPSTYHRSSREC